MRQIFLRFLMLALCVCTSATLLHAQVPDSSQAPTSVSPTLQNIEEGRPQPYTIRAIRISGLRTLDTSIILSISGLQVGQQIMIPGSDVFAKAIQSLWRQRFFSNVQIYITALEGEFIDLELVLQERPRLGNFNFVGIVPADDVERRQRP
ncbi:MAG: outer membrane protein assembly factor, partial [Sphingobacteriales bacterium]